MLVMHNYKIKRAKKCLLHCFVLISFFSIRDFEEELRVWGNKKEHTGCCKTYRIILDTL